MVTEQPILFQYPARYFKDNPYLNYKRVNDSHVRAKCITKSGKGKVEHYYDLMTGNMMLA